MTDSEKRTVGRSLKASMSIVILLLLTPVVLVLTVVVGWRQGAIRRPPHLPGDNPLNLLLPVLWGLGGAILALLALMVVASLLFLVSTVLHRRRQVAEEDPYT
jgi:hypothetical protein